MNLSAVPTMRCADTACVATIDALPATAQALFAEPQDDLFASLDWYRVVLACGMPNDAAARFLFCGSAAVFPMQTVDNGRGFGSLTTLYTCLYSPLITAAVGKVFAEFACACRSHALTRIDALPADWPHRAACIEAARDAGLSVRQFDHFGNWHEAVAGHSWTTYLADRHGTLRETIRRKLRRKHRFELITGGDRLEAGIADFESVYRRSWKEPEPFPDFNAALMRALAPLGMLRLGVLHVGETAAAAPVVGRGARTGDRFRPRRRCLQVRLGIAAAPAHRPDPGQQAASSRPGLPRPACDGTRAGLAASREPIRQHRAHPL